MARKRFDLTPEEAYDIVVAALNIAAGISPRVHQRMRRDYGPDGPGYGKFVTVNPRALVALWDALDAARPGMVADVVERAHGERLAERTRGNGRGQNND